MMSHNLLNNRKTILGDISVPGEEAFLSRLGVSWRPWVWARRAPMGCNYTNLEGWYYYFKSFTNFHKEIELDESSEITEPETTEEKMFYLYIASIKYVFNLNDKYSNFFKFKERGFWPDNDKNILGVHIRRGDACGKNNEFICGKCFSVEKYIENIEKILEKNNYDYIYIATDSKKEIENIQKAKPNWNILYLPIDRSQFLRPTTERFDIEQKCLKNSNIIPFVVDTALLDLYFLNKCKGLVAPITTSEFSKLAWILQLSYHKTLHPYINLCSTNDNIFNLSEIIKFNTII